MGERGTVLVTGGARRLGRAIALRLAAEGYRIAIHFNTSREQAEEAAAEIATAGGEALVFQAALDGPEICAGLMDRVAAAAPDTVGLVNSASIFAPDMLESMTPEFYREQMIVNAEVPLYLTQALHRTVRGTGWVLNLIDCKIEKLTPDFFSYTLSKLALENVTRMTAMACAPKLRVNAIAPGLVLRSGNQTQETYEYEHDRIPLRVGPNPEEIAEMTLSLARSPSTTGQIVCVDGGRHFYTPSQLAARFEVPERAE